MNTLNDLVKEFFKILDTKEETDSENLFSPVYISSCRVQLTEKLNNILKEMKEIVNDRKKND